MIIKDELEEFLGSNTIEVDDPILWWYQHRMDYPQLSRMAFDIFSIPAMSTEVERVFSSSGITITPRRNRLKADIIEAVECQKSWEQTGLITFQEVDQLSEMLEQLEYGKIKTLEAVEVSDPVSTTGEIVAGDVGSSLIGVTVPSTSRFI